VSGTWIFFAINGVCMFVNAHDAAVRWGQGRHGRAGLCAAGFTFSTIGFVMAWVRLS
jgi:hypothetical protein